MAESDIKFSRLGHDGDEAVDEGANDHEAMAEDLERVLSRKRGRDDTPATTTNSVRLARSADDRRDRAMQRTNSILCLVAVVCLVSLVVSALSLSRAISLAPPGKQCF